MLWNFSSNFPFWGVLRVWDGGMSAHGGVLFTVLTLIWFSWKYKVSLVNIGDAACMVVPIGLCFGRIANFVNGELYGHPSNVPWAMKFPSEVWSPTNGVETIPAENVAQLKDAVGTYLGQHPLELTTPQVQEFLGTHSNLREVISANVGGLHLDNAHHLETAKRMIAETVAQDPGKLGLYDLAHWWERGHSAVGAEMHKVFEIILPARHPSQLYEALLEGVLLFSICWAVGRLWRKEGMAGGAFLTFYPVMRIIGEQFRVGDSPQRVLGIEMSLGVIYSLIMFAAGAAYWVYWIKKDRRIPWVPVVPGSESAPGPDQPPGSPVNPTDAKP
jgi:prolipoprotein diacylglyceryltransferase